MRTEKQPRSPETYSDQVAKKPTGSSVVAHEVSSHGFNLTITDSGLHQAVAAYLSRGSTGGVINHRSMMLQGDTLTMRGKNNTPTPIPWSELKRVRQELGKIAPKGTPSRWKFQLKLRQRQPTDILNR